MRKLGKDKQRRWNAVKLYLDSYIAACFWLHLLCLMLAGAIGRSRYKKVRKRRIAAVSALCTLLDAGWLVLFGFRFTGIMTAAALVELVLAAWLAFGKTRVVQNSIVLFFVTVVLSGIFQILPFQNVGLFCCVGSLLLPLLETGFYALTAARQTRETLFSAALCRNGKERELSALMDTGNRLRLYGSSLPVVVVEEKYIVDWMKEAEQTEPQKLVFLPYKGVGGTGLLRGVRLECTLRCKTGETIGGEVAAVAAKQALFAGCEYQMLLQPEVLRLPVKKEKRWENNQRQEGKTMVCVKDTQEGEKNVV
ncbi:MAG: sigma-E processing peptidase SpoIIGA [Lachnospiraceae bacterium]|nr:sigma-E processing peptidase SpoIIGA [Lachnospiraceae bacterium]